MPQIKHYFTKLIWLGKLAVIALLLTSCFRDNLTPYISPNTAVSHRTNTVIPQKKALIVREVSSGEDQYLGLQYISGVIPVNRVYLAQNPGELLSEILSEQLVLNGYQVFISDSENAKEISQILRPHVIVSASLEDLSTNAYDAFFFRVARVSGSVKTSFYRTNPKGELLLHRQIVKDFSDSEVRKLAHVYHLSRQLKKEVSETLQEVLSSTHPATMRAKYELGNKTLNIITPGIVNLPQEGSLIEELAYSNALPKNSSLIVPKTRRLVQLAVEKALSESKYLATSSSDFLLSEGRRTRIIRPALSNISLSSKHVEAVLSIDVSGKTRISCPYRQEVSDDVAQAISELVENSTQLAMTNNEHCRVESE